MSGLQSFPFGLVRLATEAGSDKCSTLLAPGRLGQASASAPENDEGRFAALLRCDDPRCRELAAVCGDTGMDVDSDEDNGWHYVPVYRVRAISPSPLPLVVPSKTPITVRAAITAAASLLWSDPEAAVNKLRQSVEAFLSEERVPRSARQKNNTLRRLSLDQRISAYSKTPKGAPLADALRAAKWIGNAGSHTDPREGGMTRDDVMEACEIIEHVLEERYSSRRQAISKKVAAINKRRGPVPIKKSSSAKVKVQPKRKKPTNKTTAPPDHEPT
jgi:hypothetical protein